MERVQKIEKRLYKSDKGGAKANFWKTEFLSSNSSKSFWKTVSKFNGSSSNPMTDIVTDDTQKANLMNNFLVREREFFSI